MSYDKQKMLEAVNLAMQSIFQRHQPPVHEIIDMFASCLFTSIKQFVPLEEQEKFMKNKSRIMVCTNVFGIGIRQIYGMILLSSNKKTKGLYT